MTNNWRKNESNEVLDKGEYYLSYNPFAGDSIENEMSDAFGLMASILSGDNTFAKREKETAICFDGKYAILNGDYRKELEKFNTLEECLEFYNKHKKDHSVWSTYKK